MLIKKPETIKSSEITTESAYLSRRQMVSSMLKLGLVGATTFSANAQAGLLDRLFGDDKSEKNAILKPLQYQSNTGFDTSELATDESVATAYNNFYEFSLDKEKPALLAQSFKTEPWTVEVSGETTASGLYDLEDIIKRFPLQERIYRMRCVEGWSMVIPWLGFPLSDLLKYLQPTSKAMYVEFITLDDSKQFPGQHKGAFGLSSLDWPYVEGLRMDEAMNPLTLMVVGMYGKQLPPQNGAPLRLVIPWKYGFKGIKSIVKINFTENMPLNSWQSAVPNEYGFYANVNPMVDHPRWSQARERRLISGSLSGIKHMKTLPFNGYGEQVADLYKGMDLRRSF
ncbi:MAG: protein-methionine-sulfoxide reductase catalytic subunit MsrP [Gammaproteobacteria bacterium]|nr:protein-methionine-sulfoxide reductase catalytic subunit MsrP [Gammaproteobacteria bacterium]